MQVKFSLETEDDENSFQDLLLINQYKGKAIVSQMLDLLSSLFFLKTALLLGSPRFLSATIICVSHTRKSWKARNLQVVIPLNDLQELSKIWVLQHSNDEQKNKYTFSPCFFKTT